jgi:nucleotide-binding universal stress UspA family protein
MKTLLIPIDFSDTSDNVIQYAADFVKDAVVDRIILLKSYSISMFAQLLPSADYVQMSASDIQEERGKIEENVKFIAGVLQEKCGARTQVETAISELPMLQAIHQLMDQERPGLLMIGSDHPSSPDGSPIGEHVISIAKTSPVPVLIVPAGLHYQKIKQALVPCDFMAVSRLIVLKELCSSFRWLHPDLIILNVDPLQKHLVSEKENSRALKEILESYAYKVYYSEDPDTVHGILSFAEKNDVQLLIALPGQHSFFYHLTHRSVTKVLSLNATQPVLVLK